MLCLDLHTLYMPNKLVISAKGCRMLVQCLVSCVWPPGGIHLCHPLKQLLRLFLVVLDSLIVSRTFDNLASHTLRRERKGLVTLQPLSCPHGRNLM